MVVAEVMKISDIQCQVYLRFLKRFPEAIATISFSFYVYKNFFGRIFFWHRTNGTKTRLDVALKEHVKNTA